MNTEAVEAEDRREPELVGPVLPIRHEARTRLATLAPRRDPRGVPMGRFLDWMNGTRHPDVSVVPRPAAQVRAALLAVNRPNAPFVVRDGQPEGVDLVAELKFADQEWYGFFSRSKIRTVFQIHLRLDEPRCEVRNIEHERRIEWSEGVPSCPKEVAPGRGATRTMSSKRIEYRGKGRFELVPEFSLSSSDVKKELRAAATGAGWVWRRVSPGKL